MSAVRPAQTSGTGSLYAVVPLLLFKHSQKRHSQKCCHENCWIYCILLEYKKNWITVLENKTTHPFIEDVECQEVAPFNTHVISFQKKLSIKNDAQHFVHSRDGESALCPGVKFLHKIILIIIIISPKIVFRVPCYSWKLE